MNNIIVWFGLCLIPVVWFLQNVIHESSHAVIPLIKGCEVKIYPWPKHMNGRWYMAYCTWKCKEVFSTRLKLIISAAPRIVDLLIIAITAVIRPENAWANTVLQTWQVAAFIDFSFNTMGIFFSPERKNDAWAVAKHAGWTSAGWLRTWSTVITAAVAVPVVFRLF
jgi:hypothetical protein